MANSYHDPELPRCWERPWPELQSCLFSDPTDQVLANLKVSRDEVKRWRERSWVSFDIDETDALDWFRSGEIEFVRDVARSGLLDAQINELFASLPTPYRFAPQTLAYNFAYGWVVPSSDAPFEVIETNVAHWLEHLAEKHDIERLEELSDSIARHLELIQAEEEGESEEGLTDLNVELAESLVNGTRTELVLDGLTALEVNVAEALAVFKGSVSLNGLTELEVALVEVLATFNAKSLSLDGVINLSVETAEALARFKGNQLSLSGVSDLTVTAVHALAPFKGQLYLNNVKMSLELAEALGMLKARGLHLDFGSELSVEVAQALATRTRNELSLDGLTDLNADVAQALARFKGDQLSLCGLVNLEVEVADALAAYEGKWLLLNGITGLSALAAQRLSMCKANMQLNGMDGLDGDIATLLSKGRGTCLYLEGVATMDTTVAKAIAAFEGGVLRLSGLTEVDVEVAHALASFVGGSLHLDGLTDLDVDVAAALSRFTGSWLLLDGIANVDIEVARVLARFQVERVSLSSEVIDTLHGHPDLLLDAASNGCQCIVRILLNGRENISELRNEVGDTSLHIAARRGNSAIVKLLLEHKANPTSVNEAGQTPFECAVECGDVATIELLSPKN